MDYPPVPAIDEIARHFRRALLDAEIVDQPYRRWRLKNVLPLDTCTGIMTLPIAPPLLGKTDGTRGSYNDKRTFFTPLLRNKFPAVQALCSALQTSDVARVLARTLNIELSGGYLRMEYMQDIDGMWLEPHRDIPEKLFSMVIYLFTGPDSAEWGTDIYDAGQRRVDRSAPDFNSGAVFVAGPATWHGFDRRPIVGVRRLLEINYVRSDWRARDQLAFPNRPIES
nr:2OG-Fe(II) oxygenase [uncultured Rhodopila sp.]